MNVENSHTNCDLNTKPMAREGQKWLKHSLKYFQNISHDPLISIQKLALKGIAGDHQVFAYITYKLSGDIVFIAILALSRLKFLNHAHFY